MTEDLYLDDAKASLVEENVRLAWFRARSARVLASVEAHDILDHFGVKVRVTSQRGESIPCPFHGDNRPSAKVHPSNSKGPSHLWCYVCRKNWNSIQLWMAFENCTYGQALYRLERHLCLPPVPLPTGRTLKPAPSRVVEVREKLNSVERILRNKIRDSHHPRSHFYKFSVAMDRMWALLETEPMKVTTAIPGFIEKLRNHANSTPQGCDA